MVPVRVPVPVLRQVPERVRVSQRVSRLQGPAGRPRPMMKIFRLHTLKGSQFLQPANRKGSLTIGATQVHFRSL